MTRKSQSQLSILVYLEYCEVHVHEWFKDIHVISNMETYFSVSRLSAEKIDLTENFSLTFKTMDGKQQDLYSTYRWLLHKKFKKHIKIREIKTTCIHMHEVQWSRFTLSIYSSLLHIVILGLTCITFFY